MRRLPRRGARVLPKRSATRTPEVGGIARVIGPDRPPRRYRCSPLMTTNQTTDAFDTAELELALAAEAPAAAVEQDQPIWSPEDGDFN
jgi:hypothetical protein